MEKRLFLVPILIFSSLMVVFYYIIPDYKVFLVQSAEVKYFKEDIKEKKRFYEELNETKAMIGDYSEVFSRIDNAIPKEIFQPDLLTYFQKTTSDLGLLLGGISISPGGAIAEGSRIKSASISLMVEGSLASFENFLKTMEKSSRVFDVEQISFSYEASSPNMNSFNLGIKTYSY